MKKFLSFALSLLLIVSQFAGCSKSAEYTFSPKNQGDLTIVSFNVAAPWGNLLDGTGSGARAKRFAAYMNAVKPDSIGTQEMNSSWMRKLAALMPDYDSYGVVRGGDDNEKKSEMNSIFWLKDKYDCIEKNTFWLSATPDEESRYDGAGCNRVCSYVILKNKDTGKEYIHMNTHLDNASEEARMFGAQVIVDKINAFKDMYDDMLIVLSGDFNETMADDACKLIDSVMNTEYLSQNTYHQWGEISQGEPIDYIFVGGAGKDNIADTMILDDISNGYVSDHYGVCETIDM
ncbi:MAG: hypothetical protein NC397_05495 [Clostridium sp.]|nr:hypothetical protein [Clostridium sp.]